MAGSSENRWWSQDTLAVVTGGNKGIGYDIVKQLAQHGITTVLTSRDVTRGENATKQLREDGLPVVYHQLDVTSAESARTLASWLKQHHGGVDILINNAGISLEAFDAPPIDSRAVTTLIQTNYYGARHVTNAILPLLKSSPAGARIINVSSQAGSIKLLAKESVRHSLSASVGKLTEEALDAIVDNYLADAAVGKHVEWVNPGSPFAVYAISKVFLNAYTRVLARMVASRTSGEKIYVNSFCPGFTLTDMNRKFLELPVARGFRPHSTEVAARNAVSLALLPAEQVPSGSFIVQNRESQF